MKRFLRDRMGFREAVYLLAVLKGMALTIRMLWRNFWNMSGLPTLRYPEQKRVAPERYRGVHRLTKREDGTVKCTACMLCATACPAVCIHIEATEGADDEFEKYPKVYTIDMLRCVYCGLCVEACPCDAIRMDTGIHPPPASDRKDFIYTIDRLMSHEPASRNGE